MIEAFIPFDPANRAPARVLDGSSELKVVPRPEAPPAFLSLSELGSGHDHGLAASPRLAEPRITVQRDGERVTGIRVTCTCGQVIELACSY